MKKYTEKLLKTIPYIIIALLVGVTAVYAGSLTPPGAPSKTMKSLSDLYELINTGANTPSTDFTTPATVAPTMHSLGDTYDLLATKISNIDTTKILTGTSIFGKAGSASAGSAFSSSPLKTGQTHCNQFADNYNSSSQVPCPGTNQDGESQRGIARSYTDNTDGTITDNKTGLMWQKCTNGQTGLNCDETGVTPDFGATATVFDDGNGVSPAINYCESLSLATHTDWHLPTVNELQTLADYGRVNPAIDTTYFPNTQSDSYWSSTAYEDGANYVWIVYFYGGYVGNDGMDDNNFVRCVRE